MSFQEELYYKIEAYLSGELDAGEMAAFESQISADDLLKAEVEKHKVANALIMEQRLLSVKTMLQEERAKDRGSNNFLKPFGFILMGAVAVGIGASVWMLNQNDEIASSEKSTTPSEKVVSLSGKTGKKSIAESQKSTLQDASKYNASEDIGFHKQQIQQLEEHVHADEKGVLHIDSSFVVKNAEVKSTAPVPSQASSGKTTTAVDPCSNVSIQASVITTLTCSHEATGAIRVQNIKGGVKPYNISIVNAQNFNDEVVNGSLKAGMYQVYITDANTCERSYSVQITEKDCPIDYSFNPFYGNEEWEVPVQNVDRELEIYDKGGMLYVRKHIPASASFKWNGMGNGNQIVPGYYIFVMKYVNGTIQRGSVTIVQ